ncbi:hypothetical protein [Aminipila terrae]|uniref:Uncharacterized protein n=1 Tax=Aminipila terrae TaxID=2697030 RepID=A0A6P1MFJ0_9FIRM|nr:hypothetical protein [Aminipila terrae]QHI73460.1 hypothetical protein Ami3637_14705 [Aminipila terrae]
MKLTLIEEQFNKIFDFEALLEQSKKYIEKALQNSESNFLSDEANIDDDLLKEIRIEYNKTSIFINNAERMPYFRLEFYLHKSASVRPMYIYEIEFNCEGQFADEYFLEY